MGWNGAENQFWVKKKITSRTTHNDARNIQKDVWIDTRDSDGRNEYPTKSAILAPCWPLKWAKMGPKINFGRKIFFYL
jgi:hypothetical protein